MGHADFQVLLRYLAQTTEDIAQAHRIGSPTDIDPNTLDSRVKIRDVDILTPYV
jgi:hypothetical protein